LRKIEVASMKRGSPPPTCALAAEEMLEASREVGGTYRVEIDIGWESTDNLSEHK
jgi:hypothetical protein